MPQLALCAPPAYSQFLYSMPNHSMPASTAAEIITDLHVIKEKQLPAAIQHMLLPLRMRRWLHASGTRTAHSAQGLNITDHWNPRLCHLVGSEALDIFLYIQTSRA